MGQFGPRKFEPVLDWLNVAIAPSLTIGVPSEHWALLFDMAHRTR